MESSDVQQIQERVESTIDSLRDRLATIEDAFRSEGFDVTALLGFVFRAGLDLTRAVQQVQDLTPEQRREAVIITVQDLYEEIDPDIPWVPEPFESQIESLILSHAVPAAIDELIA